MSKTYNYIKSILCPVQILQNHALQMFVFMILRSITLIQQSIRKVLKPNPS